MTRAWYVLLALMFAAFAVGEGWDFGTGALHLLVARSPAERRQVVRAVAPLWSWNEVWLIAAGGVLFLAFPKVFATALSGYYLAVFLLLWCMVLRGIALEVVGHLADPMWQAFWDAVFAGSSALLALLFGAAFGNVLRGVPIGDDGRMFLPLFTDFGMRGRVGILDWYTLSVALFTLVLLAAHGATGLARRTSGPLELRSQRFARWLWPAVVILLPVVSVETGLVRPGFFASIAERPAAWLAVLALAAGLFSVLLGMLRGRQSLAFAGSCLVVAGLVGGAAASMYPEMLHSTLDPANSITAANGAADEHGLRMALVWWPIALVLSLGYAGYVARRTGGKVHIEETRAVIALSSQRPE
jgi:cytochrome d ubiquinol oxidase subunit II